MSFRQVIVRKSQKIRVENSNLTIEKDNEIIYIPLEDIFLILVEDPNTVITTRLICKCSEYRISIIVCNEKYQPCSITLAYNQHHRSLYVHNLQNKLCNEKKQILWQEIIKRKIYNQHQVVKYTTNVESDLKLLKEYINSVKESDIDNREGISAKVFFKSLYGTEFIRFYDDAINSAMNYGYAIIASAITRELVSFGLDPKLGIWHENKSNSFNLSYDLVEVYRPLVDYCIYENLHFIEGQLTLHVRKELINLLNVKLEMNGKKQILQYSITQLVKSYIGVLEGKKEGLELPKIEKVDFYISE